MNVFGAVLSVMTRRYAVSVIELRLAMQATIGRRTRSTVLLPRRMRSPSAAFAVQNKEEARIRRAKDTPACQRDSIVI
jgi:hypothetical protein